MPASAFQRLTRVLELEERQGWRNRAVIGGLQAMAERWEHDAAEEAEDVQVVATVVRLMGRYDAAEVAARPEIANAIRRALAGEPVTIEPASGADASAADLSASEAAGPADVAQAEEGSPAPGAPAMEGGESGPASPIPPPEPTHVAEARVRRRQTESHRSPADLDNPPTVLKGVGKTVAEQLAKLGITRVRDLIWHLPARHDDYSQQRTIDQLRPGDQATVIANLWEVQERKISMQRQMVIGILGDSTGTLRATWWNKYVARQLSPGSTLRFSGKVGLYMGNKTLENPAFEDLDEEMVATGRLSPVYPLTEGLSNKRLRSLIKQVLDEYLTLLDDPLPEELRTQYGLPDLQEALAQVHLPESVDALNAGLRRLAFEELLYVQLGVLRQRAAIQEEDAPALTQVEDVLARYVASLPFELTGAQQRVMEEMAQDLKRTVPMTRMVQGDVGSGKTAVAAAGMVLAAANGTQSALLAPTQILAEQHHRSLSELLANQTRPDGRPLQVALLTGRVSGSEREEVVAGLAAGTLDIVVGTTALIQDGVEFADLGLIIVDEQHRFGVAQRSALRNKADRHPHLLVMSATPIPRSLALTVYGDLDLSIIDEMPPGRIPMKTKVFHPPERERLYAFMRREAQEGRQAFIVYPLVEESEKLDAGSAVAEYERLQQEVFPDRRLGLLHGQMSGQEKDEVMRAFAGGDYDILVSTTVIEVGIDVPNASLIMIEDADRFGLAQLHQLRGRVGRGVHKSYCALVSKAETPGAQERLQALATMHSGFDLAEKDLELRGPGDFLGTRQSGLPDLRVAQLGDATTIVTAREAAQSLFAGDPSLASYPQLVARVEQFWRGEGDIS